MPISSGYGKRLPLHILKEPLKYKRVYDSKCSLCTLRHCFLCEHDTPLRDQILFNKESTKSLPDLNKINSAKLRKNSHKKNSSISKENDSKDVITTKNTLDIQSNLSTEKKGFLFCIRRQTSFTDLI